VLDLVLYDCPIIEENVNLIISALIVALIRFVSGVTFDL